MVSRHHQLLISLFFLFVLFIFTVARFRVDSIYDEIKLPGGSNKDVEPPSSSTHNPTTSVISRPHGSPPGAPTSQSGVPANSKNITGELVALTELCQKTQWTPGLWLHCHSTCGSTKTSVCGGLNNARNRIQTCLRYAIDAGAGIIIPSAVTRSETDLKDTDGGQTVCPDFFWNMESLKKSLEGSCPQMSLRLCDDRVGINRVIQAPHRGYADQTHYKNTFRKVIQQVLAKNNIKPNSMIEEPVLVNFADSLMGWSYSKSDEISTVRKDLYKVLTFNQDLLDMSYELLDRPELYGGQVIGVHLRGESDWPDDFGTAKDQMKLYKEEIKNIQAIAEDLRTVYVSSGDKAVIQTFRGMLSPLGYTVHDKWTLFASNQTMLTRINALPFDQKGILEYEILVNSKFFLGPAMSSMTSLIAYQRSLNETQDIFTAHIFPGSTRNDETKMRTYPTTPVMRGDTWTKLMVVNNYDIMDNFP